MAKFVVDTGSLTLGDLGVALYDVRRHVNAQGEPGWMARCVDHVDEAHEVFSTVSYTDAVERVAALACASVAAARLRARTVYVGVCA